MKIQPPKLLTFQGSTRLSQLQASIDDLETGQIVQLACKLALPPNSNKATLKGFVSTLNPRQFKCAENALRSVLPQKHTTPQNFKDDPQAERQSQGQIESKPSRGIAGVLRKSVRTGLRVARRVVLPGLCGEDGGGFWWETGIPFLQPLAGAMVGVAFFSLFPLVSTGLMVWGGANIITLVVRAW